MDAPERLGGAELEKAADRPDRPVIGNGLCGDVYCPCQDGDLCHYEAASHLAGQAGEAAHRRHTPASLHTAKSFDRPR